MIHRYYLILVYFTITCASCFAQYSGEIETHIEFKSWILPSSPPIQRSFIGVFDFESMPKPLEFVTVNYELEATMMNGGTIQIRYDSNKVVLDGPSEFYWAPPTDRGQKYYGSVRLMPLVSGPARIEFIMKNAGARDKGLVFGWCLDENGDVLCLGPRPFYRKCRPLYCNYFNQDSVHIRDKLLMGGVIVGNWDITISPTPVIGDTSELVLRIHRYGEFNDRAKFSVGARAYDIIQESMNLKNIDATGRTIELRLLLVPSAVNTSPVFSCKLIRPRSEEGINESATASFGCVFANDGSLRYISSQGAGLAAHELVPTTFRDEIPSQDRVSIELGSVSQH